MNMVIKTLPPLVKQARRINRLHKEHILMRRALCNLFEAFYADDTDKPHWSIEHTRREGEDVLKDLPPHVILLLKRERIRKLRKYGNADHQAAATRAEATLRMRRAHK